MRSAIWFFKVCAFTLSFNSSFADVCIGTLNSCQNEISFSEIKKQLNSAKTLRGINKSIEPLVGNSKKFRDFLNEIIIFNHESSAAERAEFVNSVVELVKVDLRLYSYVVHSLLYTIVEIKSEDCCFSDGRKVRTTTKLDHIAHEFHHAFSNHFDPGRGLSAIEEGYSIALGKNALGQEVDLCETIFGTKLYYRDYGVHLLGMDYPKDVPWGTYLNSNVGQPLKDLAQEVRNKSTCGADLVSTELIVSRFDQNWICRNRNVQWEEWLVQVSQAKTSTCSHEERILRHPSPGAS